MADAPVTPRQLLRNPTASYVPGRGGHLWGIAAQVLDGKPFFTWLDIPRMIRDPQVRFVERMWRAPFQQVKWRVQAEDPRVARYVDRTLRRFWKRNLPPLLSRYFRFGFAAGGAEFCYRKGLVRLERVRTVEPADTRQLTWTDGPRRGRLAGFEARGVRVLAPHAMWFAGHAEIGPYHDAPPLSGMFQPWLEKNGRNGAVDSRRTWFYRNAASGVTIRHPKGTSNYGTDENPQVRDNQDVARELGDYYQTNGVLTFENEPNPGMEGHFAWEVDEPKSRADLAGFREYPGDLDKEMQRGAGIPPEVTEASEVGSGWSGRMIPLEAFLGGVDELAGLVIESADAWLRYAVEANFGRKTWYEVDPVSLVEQLRTQAAGGGPNPVPGLLGTGKPVEMSDGRDEEFEAIRRRADRIIARRAVELSAGPDTRFVAGLAVRAGDTGRVLMLKRGPDPTDPAAGTWEFPGGHLKADEVPLDGAKREWGEEVGTAVPPGEPGGMWRSGVYQGHVWHTPTEVAIPPGAGDQKEEVAWRHPDELAGGTGLRPELAATLPRVLPLLKAAPVTMSAGDGGDRDLAAAVTLAMLKAQEWATARGKPDAARPYLDQLAELAADKDRLQEVLGIKSLAWVPYEGTRGGKGWKNTDTGRVIYGHDKPGERRERQQASAAKARELTSKVLHGEATAADLTELTDHLPALTVQQLRDARVKLGASFGGQRQRDAMVRSLLDHVRERVQGERAKAAKPPKKSTPPAVKHLRDIARTRSGPAKEIADAELHNIGKSDDPKVLARRLASAHAQAVEAGLPAEDVAAFEAAAKAHGMEKIGEQGGRVKFDPEVHQSAHPSRAGDEHEVITPGWLHRPDSGPAYMPAPAETRPAQTPGAGAAKVKKPKPSANKGQDSLVNVVKRHGGIDPQSHDLLRHYESAKEATQNGIPVGVFKRGGVGLDTLASELHNGGHISVPEGRDAGEHLLEQLQKKAASHHADLTDQYQKAEEEYYRRVQEAADAAADQSEIDAAVRSGEEAGAAEEEDGDVGEVQGEHGQAGGGDPGEEGGPDDPAAGGEVDDSFAFGANAADEPEPTAPAEEEPPTAEPTATDPFESATADHTPALNAIPAGSLGWVAGYPVRRTSDGRFQVETGKAYRTGAAAEINQHIKDAWRQAGGEAPAARKALERAAAFQEPDWFGGGKAAEDVARRRAKVPDGARGVSLEPHTRGRVGKVVRDPETGAAHLLLDGQREVKATDFEPLQSSYSWRTPEAARPEIPKAKQGDLFAQPAERGASHEAPTGSLRDRARQASNTTGDWAAGNLKLGIDKSAAETLDAVLGQLDRGKVDPRDAVRMAGSKSNPTNYADPKDHAEANDVAYRALQSLSDDQIRELASENELSGYDEYRKDYDPSLDQTHPGLARFYRDRLKAQPRKPQEAGVQGPTKRTFDPAKADQLLAAEGGNPHKLLGFKPATFEQMARAWQLPADELRTHLEAKAASAASPAAATPPPPNPAPASPAVDAADFHRRLDARDRSTKNSEANSLAKIAAGLTPEQATAALKATGMLPEKGEDPRRTLVDSIIARQGSKVRTGLSFRPGSKEAAEFEALKDEPLTSTDALLGAKPKEPAPKKPVKEIPPAKKPAPAGPPQTPAGKQAAGIYDRAATATDEDVEAARKALKGMASDELRRVAEAMGHFGPVTPQQLVDRIIERRGTTIRRGLIDRPATPPSSRPTGGA